MAAESPRFFAKAARLCASVVLTAALWTLWLGLALLIALQIHIASVKELEVPRFLLRAIEDHLAESGVTVTFGQANFDPTGRILIRNASIRLASFNEPIVTANDIYVRLDPWALLERRLEPREIRAMGADLFIPAMLSTSGRPEKLIQDLDAGFSITSRGDEFSLDYLNCRLGGVSLSAHGTINAGTVTRKGVSTSLPLTAFIAKNYVALSREFLRAEERMQALDQGVATAVLEPSDTRGAMVKADLYAAGLKLSDPLALDAEGIHASGRFPLLGSAPFMTGLNVSAARLTVAGRTAVRVRGQVRGLLKLDTLEYMPREILVAAAAASGDGAELFAPVASVSPHDGRRMRVELTSLLFGAPVWARADLDLAAKSADIAFDAAVSPEVIEPLSARFKLKNHHLITLAEPVALSGQMFLDPGWKFTSYRGRIDGRGIDTFGVHIDEARGQLTFADKRLKADHATLISGDNMVRGTYEQDFATLGYRYLLEGRLRPLEISSWFRGGWWEAIFTKFAFPEAPPDATVDVQGRYVRGRNFSVFLYVDTKKPVILKAPFDRVQTRFFLNQSVLEGYEAHAEKGAQSANGSFKAQFEPGSGAWSGIDVETDSKLDPASVVQMLPPGAAAVVNGFSFEKPPSISMQGHFDGPATQGVRHQAIHAEVRTDAAMKAHGVAFSRAFFKFDVRDADIDVSEVEAGFAGGTATGKANLSGPANDRRLRFKASLTRASLGSAADAAEGYVVKGTAKLSTALDTFARDKSEVRLDLNVSAEGQPDDLASFSGNGNVQIQGSELGALSLLGGLSRILKVTELRFTQAQAEFDIEKGSLVFPKVSVIGANSAIVAKGTYSMDKRQLDFSARVYPFRESGPILKALDFATAPFSAMFAVKLTGSIDKPSWSLHPLYAPITLPRPGELRPEAPEKPSTSPLPTDPSP